jgi:hypothetical protein
MTIPKAELKLAVILNSLAKDVLTASKSVINGEIPNDILSKLFSKEVKFKTKVDLIKPFLRQPNRLALVKNPPTLERPVERFDPVHFKLIEIFYALRCLVAVIPNSEGLCDEIVETLSLHEPSKLTESDLSMLLEALNKLRGIDSAVSAVVSAASKIFFTVDGLAFDDFAVSLTVQEWEIITESMNSIRLEYADEMRRISTEEYHLTTSKQNKILDKNKLEQSIHKARGPLLQIMKLTKDDLHPFDQQSILKAVSLSSSNKKIRSDRKTELARAKKKFLEHFRHTPEMDVKKFVLKTQVLS